jgi:hypothetical protein
MMHPQVDCSPVQPPVRVGSLLLTDQDIASIFGVTTEWVHSHAPEIPGFKRLGSYFRFCREMVEKWLGELEPLLDAAGAASLMGVPKSWVYANADEIPGVLRLGHYVRFRPAVLLPFLQGSEVVQ